MRRLSRGSCFLGVEIQTIYGLPNFRKYLNDFYELELQHGSGVVGWSIPVTKGIVPSPRESHTAVIYCKKDSGSPKMYVFGGMCGARLDDLWQLDLETMSWSKPETKGTVPLPRSLHTASVIGNKMYIFGGWVPHKGENIETSPHDCEWRCTSSFSYLNLDTAEWTTLVSDSQEDKKNSRPRPRAGHCAVAIGTRLYFWSGRDGYKKALNSQVCCKDLWYLDTEKPPAPSQVQLIKATTNSFHVKWDEVPTVEGYLLQLNTDLPYQAASSDSSAAPNMQGVRMDPHRQGSNSTIPNSISDTMNSTKTEHTAMKGTSVKNRPDLKASTDSNATLHSSLATIHSSLATNASNHNSCVVDVLRKNEGPHTSANIGVLSSCLDLRTVIPETSVSSSVSSAQTMVTQQTIKTESSSTNGAVVKDETSLTTFSTKSEVDEACALPATKISRVETHATVMPFSKETPSNPVATVKAGERQWCDVGIFKNNTALVSQFYLLPKGKQSISKIGNADAPDYSLLKKQDLVPGTGYRFRVAAINGCGIGPFSKISEFKTCIPGFPGAPSAVRISKNVEGIHLSWEPPTSPSGNILEYSAYLAIRTAQIQDNPSQLVFMRIYCGLKTSCIVTAGQLANAHIDYTSRPAIVFRISAKNEKGYGPATQVRWLQVSTELKKLQKKERAARFLSCFSIKMALAKPGSPMQIILLLQQTFPAVSQKFHKGQCLGSNCCLLERQRMGALGNESQARASDHKHAVAPSGTSLDRSTGGGRGEKLKCWVLARQRRGKGMQESDETMDYCSSGPADPPRLPPKIKTLVQSERLPSHLRGTSRDSKPPDGCILYV
ncbi:hypothetical protein GH733_017666 [Mirounga leonina]|nr:hypothetical protein GH733_017666 [Mirounga leonina]